MATLNQVAEIARVSVTTASRVLNNIPSAISISEKTRKKVLKASEKLGYQANIFARSLRTKRTNIIGAATLVLDHVFHVTEVKLNIERGNIRDSLFLNKEVSKSND